VKNNSFNELDWCDVQNEKDETGKQEPQLSLERMKAQTSSFSRAVLPFVIAQTFCASRDGLRNKGTSARFMTMQERKS